ncbi:MAG: hypothetical protein GXO83_08510 [Chlorobi bacterium]|nr:hypothetical protein [Chlorobiota bacterium]
MKRYYILTAFLLFFVVVSTGMAQDSKVTVPLRFDHYYPYEQVVAALKALNKAYPSLTHLNLVGHSEENRQIWAITINNPKTGKESDKPGVYVDGNIHGNEIQASEVCLYFVNYLLTNYGKNDKITKLVDKNAYYVIPTVNVDGRYHFFHDANTPSTNRGLRRPKDDDHDGLVNEDFPDDLDGDGNICIMRKRDPNGKYKTDPEDARLMIRVKPGEKGEWTILGQEGIDNDGDGRINEDAEGYVDPNRNWGYNWAPPYVQSGAGDYPFSGLGIKAIAKFILDRPNIIMVWAFHNNGGMILRGPSTKAEGKLNTSDISVYDYLGKNGEKIVPGYRYLISWKDLYSTYGDFTDFTDNIVGAYSLVGELFRTADETYSKPGKTSGGDDEIFGGSSNERSRERLKFNDHLAMGELYKPWTPFHHPVYGDIEIGGWVKMSSRLPHPFMLEDLVHRNASAVIFSAEQTPEIKMEVTGKKKTGKNLYQIRIRLTNSKAMPSMTYHSVKKKAYPMDMLKVLGTQVKVVAGGKLVNEYTGQTNYKKYKPEVQFVQVPGFGKTDYQFLVEGKGTVTILFESRKAGKKTVTFKL